jgi:hypothetical protein
MQGSVVWATVISLLLGCVIGVAAMGAFLLPVQFKLEQEQLASKQQLIEMENADAVNKLAETQRQLLKKKP